MTTVDKLAIAALAHLSLAPWVTTATPFSVLVPLSVPVLALFRFKVFLWAFAVPVWELECASKEPLATATLIPLVIEVAPCSCFVPMVSELALAVKCVVVMVIVVQQAPSTSCSKGSSGTGDYDQQHEG